MHPLTRNCHRRGGTALSPLTERETDVLTWIANGKTAWEIGQLLNLSHRTIEWHVQRVLVKLDTANATQAVANALRNHWIA